MHDQQVMTCMTALSIHFKVGVFRPEVDQNIWCHSKLETMKFRFELMSIHQCQWLYCCLRLRWSEIICHSKISFYLAGAKMLTDLPRDLTTQICAYLELDEIAVCFVVNKAWRQCCLMEMQTVLWTPEREVRQDRAEAWLANCLNGRQAQIRTLELDSSEYEWKGGIPKTPWAFRHPQPNPFLTTAGID